MNTKALKQKILDLAIHGKLLPLAKVEKIRKEDPASILLEKIRAEKEAKIAKGELKKDKKDSFIFLDDDKRHYEKFADGSIKDIEDEIPFDIPDGWSWCRLKEISLDMADGPFGSNLKTEHYTTKKEARLIQLSNIGEEGWREENTKYTTFEHAKKNISRSIVESGNIVIAKMMPAGRAIICPNNEKMYVLSSDAVKLIPSILIYSKYLLNTINSPSFRNSVTDNVQGSTRLRTSISKLKECFIPLPPLSEQQLIVTEIEKIFAQIDLLEQNKTDLQTAIKQAKSKILDLAIHAKLVPQDPNDEPASILLEKIRVEKEAKIAKGKLKKDKKDSFIFLGDDKRHYEKFADGSIKDIEDEIPFDIPDGWSWCRLGEICEFIGGVSYKKNDITNTGIKILRGGNIQAGKIIDEIDDVFVPSSYFDKNNSVYENDIVLVASTGSNILIGKTGFAYKNLQNTQIGAFLRIIRTNNSFYAKYNNIILLSEYYKTYIRNIAGGTNINNIKTEYLSNFLIPLPPLSEQQRIVSKIEEIFAILDRISNELGIDI
ncbi:restriction endonuclease subunit S [Campylobacter lanienae]|uniref:restriction endonuclease subunit S n=1 Tax=Campylobacter lanienae TaxID=75658 RepID=UPI000BB3ECE4|nr:restriction endonuclease subunit S [Campylobacter lanienae]